MPVTNRGREAQRRGGKKGGAVASKAQRFRIFQKPKPKDLMELLAEVPKTETGYCPDCRKQFFGVGVDALRRTLLAHWEKKHRSDKHVVRLPTTLEELEKFEQESKEPEMVPLAPEEGEDAA